MSKPNSGHVGEQDFRKLVLARLGNIEKLLDEWVPKITVLLATVVKDQDDLDKRVTKLEGEEAA
ncbi:MAG: hypothetical protein F4X47_05555 [Gammaproteobacteria bacterium]|nr:hypothetical protein [Gammaproteobacteria bacterium]MYC51767.1 hypothetical protein [Gammaproteobacteria bacterium]